MSQWQHHISLTLRCIRKILVAYRLCLNTRKHARSSCQISFFPVPEDSHFAFESILAMDQNSTGSVVHDHCYNSQLITLVISGIKLFRVVVNQYGSLCK